MLKALKMVNFREWMGKMGITLIWESYQNRVNFDAMVMDINVSKYLCLGKGRQFYWRRGLYRGLNQFKRKIVNFQKFLRSRKSTENKDKFLRKRGKVKIVVGWHLCSEVEFA